MDAVDVFNDLFVNKDAEIERLRKALGEQTEMARRWKNRASSAKSKHRTAAAARDALRKATGELDPALVAKALAVVSEGFDLHDFTEDEIAALEAAAFEVTE